jgi:hypothetical protein
MPKSSTNSTTSTIISPTASSSSSEGATRYDPTALARGRVHEIHSRMTRRQVAELEIKRKLVPKLAQRAYHLEEGNSWFTDWVQYQKNTHPVFGICCHHRYHPVRFPQRVIILVGSIACGFAITNCIYLGFLENVATEIGLESVYNATGTVTDNVISAIQQRYSKFEVTQNMIYLLTIGSFLHSTFDMLIWYLMACFCFRPGGCRRSANDVVIDDRDKVGL